MSEPFGSKWKKYKIWPQVLGQNGGSVDHIKLNIGNSTGIQGTTGLTGAQGATGATGSGASGNVPDGGIILWSGAVLDIPTDWALCDGSQGTPNLTDRFVVGAGVTYTVNDSGGSADAVLVSHTHTATVTDPGHTHDANADGGSTDASGPNFRREDNNTGDLTTETATTGISVSNTTEGVSATDKNLPPYYALAYIMKLTVI